MEGILISARRLYAAYNKGDMETFVGGCHPEIELHSRFTGAPGGRVYRGYEGLQKWARDLQEVWEYFEVELEALAPLEGDRVLALATLHGKGRGSGLELREKVAHISAFRDGLLRELHTYTDRAPVLDELGLREEEALRHGVPELPEKLQDAATNF